MLTLPLLALQAQFAEPSPGARADARQQQEALRSFALRNSGDLDGGSGPAGKHGRSASCSFLETGAKGMLGAPCAPPLQSARRCPHSQQLPTTTDLSARPLGMRCARAASTDALRRAAAALG